MSDLLSSGTGEIVYPATRVEDVCNTSGKSIIDIIYPVGSIYMSVNSTNPSTFLGGTWERIKDRFLLAAGDTYSAGATGGSATHTITAAEMPKHTHTFTGTAVTSGNESAGHTHSVGAHAHGLNSHTHSIPALSGTTNSAGAHNHKIAGDYEANVPGGAGYSVPILNNTGTQINHVSTTGAHTHTVTTTASTSGKASGSTANSTAFNTGAVSANHTHSVTAKGTNSNTGSSSAMNIMNPYLSVYIWKRTA